MARLRPLLALLLAALALLAPAAWAQKPEADLDQQVEQLESTVADYEQYAANPGGGGERILSYLSEIDVAADGTLNVTETITVNAMGREIRRGIYRDFPTNYLRNNRRVRVGFEVRGVERDGQRRALCDRADQQRQKDQDRRRRHPHSARAGTPTSSATPRPGRSASSTAMTSSTGTSPATTGPSRSTGPRSASACRRRSPFEPAHHLYRPRRARRDEHDGEVVSRAARRDRLPDDHGRSDPREGFTVAVALAEGRGRGAAAADARRACGSRITARPSPPSSR